MISVFDIFKVGIGPSSSHTVGPMRAAGRFLERLAAAGLLDRTERVHARLYGSLAWTGRGHASDTAVMLGLSGEAPDTVDPDAVPGIVARARQAGRLQLGGRRPITFDPEADLVLDRTTPTPGHPNTLRFTAFDRAGAVLDEADYWSVGGGFVVDGGQAGSQAGGLPAGALPPEVPYPYRSGADLLVLAARHKLTIAEMVLANERTLRPEPEVKAGLAHIRATMEACIERGLGQDGILPGGLNVPRRARALHLKLQGDARRNRQAPHEAMDWVSLFAIAVNEENAAGGRVVTAPTNGAAGVIPAVLRYYRLSCDGTEAGADDFLLTASAIAALFKMNASISGAEVGCQGEVGVAASMAAAGLAAALGGSVAQVENAAEIGMEHHLGMTCDPIGGLVQIPCIERNAMGAGKAIAAASLALRGDGTHHVSLDQVVATMRSTGHDMAAKYKETSQGGLAVNAVEC